MFRVQSSQVPRAVPWSLGPLVFWSFSLVVRRARGLPFDVQSSMFSVQSSVVRGPLVFWSFGPLVPADWLTPSTARASADQAIDSLPYRQQSAPSLGPISGGDDSSKPGCRGGRR